MAAVLKVKHKGNPGRYILINPDDFNPKTMKRVEEEVAEKAPTPSEVEGPYDIQNRAEAIANAINAVDADKENWTKSGKPTVGAIEAILGWNIDAKERDAIWDKLKDMKSS